MGLQESHSAPNEDSQWVYPGQSPAVCAEIEKELMAD